VKTSPLARGVNNIMNLIGIPVGPLRVSFSFASDKG